LAPGLSKLNFVGAAGKTIAESGAGAGSGSFDAEFFNMSKSGTSGTVFEMQEAGTSKQTIFCYTPIKQLSKNTLRWNYNC
jgi:hypothetical protein